MCMNNNPESGNFLTKEFAFYKYVYSKESYEYFSPSISCISGYSPDEINKIGLESIITEKLETREIVSQTGFNLFSEFSAKYLICTKDGKIKTIYSQSYNQLDENNNKIAAFGILYETATGENKNYVKDVGGNYLLPDEYAEIFLFAVDVEKKIQFLNNAALRYINPKLGDPAGQSLGKCLYDQDNEFAAVVEDFISGKNNFSQPVELTFTFPDQSKKIISLSLVNIQDNSVPCSVVILGKDISSDKSAEEKNSIISELKSLNSSKDKLISQISHDLRSPFNSLLGFSEILTTEYETLTKKEIFEYLHAIYEASKNLFGMTNNLLHFSRFQAGRMEFKPEKLVLLKIINKCLSLLKGNAIKKEINISLDIDKDIEVFADEDMLISIIQNLVSNAVKFTEKSGRVSISARQCDDENFVEISIKDSGIGMSNENLKKIFSEKFYSTPGTDKEFGTGLGLILIKDFIEKHKGKLEVESETGKGSIFRFKLPVIPQ